MTNNQSLSIDQRREILQSEINKYVKKGFRVESQTETTAQLIKPKKFSLLVAVLLLVLFVLPFIIYLLWYVAKRDQTVYITVDENGKVKVRK